MLVFCVAFWTRRHSRICGIGAKVREYFEMCLKEGAESLFDARPRVHACVSKHPPSQAAMKPSHYKHGVFPGPHHRQRRRKDSRGLHAESCGADVCGIIMSSSQSKMSLRSSVLRTNNPVTSQSGALNLPVNTDRRRDGTSPAASTSSWTS